MTDGLVGLGCQIVGVDISVGRLDSQPAKRPWQEIEHLLVRQLVTPQATIFQVCGSANLDFGCCATVAGEIAQRGTIGNQVFEVLVEHGEGERTNISEIPFSRQVVVPGFDRFQQPVTGGNREQRSRVQGACVSEGVGIVEKPTTGLVRGQIGSGNTLGCSSPDE